MNQLYVTSSWDDGHVLDVRLAALLKKYGMPGTFYVSPHDREFSQSDLLTDDQVKSISHDFEIGAHTMTHPQLPLISDDKARHEIVESKKYLEELIGKPVNAFCYPRGKYEAKHIEMVREAGFTYARTIKRHFFTSGPDFEARTTIHCYDHWSDVKKILKFCNYNPLAFIKYYRHWDVLAMDMFDQARERGGMFHLWGHSWEINKHNDWERLERVLAYVSKKSDTKYVSNSDFVRIPEHRTVAIVTPHFPPHEGGVQRYALEIAKRLKDSHGWRVIVITSHRSKHDSKEEYAGLTVYRLATSVTVSNTPFSLSWFWKVRRILKAERPDVINIHAPVPGIGDVAAAVAGRTPVILTYHGGSMRKGKLAPDMIVWCYEHLVLPLLLRKARHITCSSDFVRFDFLGAAAQKSSTITPATDTFIFKPEPSLKSQSPTILFVAGLHTGQQFKGLMSLIEACTIVRESVPDLRLLVVGDGDMRPKYEYYAAHLGLKDTVVFAGKLFGTDLARTYQSAHVFALPTENDSFPTVIVEAMASGLPVVSTSVGAIPTLVDDGKTGFVIAPKDTKALAEKLALLLNDCGLRARMGEAGHAKVSTNYSWNDRAQRYSDLFHSAACGEKIVAGPARSAMSSIVHVVPYYPPHIGGMEQRVRDLVRVQVKAGLSVRVLTSNICSPTGTHLIDGAKVTYMRALKFAYAPIAPALIWKLLTIKKPALIHLHVVLAYYPELTAFIARLRRIPYIAHPRALISHDEVWKHYPKVLAFFSVVQDKYLLGFVMRGAAQVIALTPDFKQIIHDRYRVPLDRITVIPNATGYAPADAPRTAPHVPVRILAVGRIATQKNYPFMLKVAERLMHTHHLNFTLTIVGPGTGRFALQEDADRMGLADVVTFVGEKLGKELEEEYERADLFLHTSLFEGFSTSFLEATSKALPIVASDVIGTRSVIKDGKNGLLAPLDVDRMCEAVIRLSTDLDLYRRASEFNLLDVQQYSWPEILRKTVGVYDTAYRGFTMQQPTTHETSGPVSNVAPKASVVIPTYNSAKTIGALLDAVFSQQMRDFEVICVDSSSKDATPEILAKYPIKRITIDSKDFNHGSTRNMAAREAAGEFVLFLSHDSIPAGPTWLEEMIKPFQDPQVVGVYGRQIARSDEKVIDKYFHSSLYGDKPLEWHGDNWTEGDNIFSDANSAVRKSVFLEDPYRDIIVSEDYEWAARVLEKGYKIIYSTAGAVVHSHNYTLYQLFRRNFDVGVSYRDIYAHYSEGKFIAKGLRAMWNEARLLAKAGYTYLIPAAVLRNAVRYIAIELGKRDHLFGTNFKRNYLSAQRAYWK